MESSNGTDTEISSLEFNLEDSYEHLKELQTQEEQEIKDLMNIIRNNEVKSLGSNITPDEIYRKRLKFIKSLEKFIVQDQPKNLPIPKTNDFYTYAIQGIKDEVPAIEELVKITKEEITEIEFDIISMEKKKTSFEQMREAYLSSVNNQSAINYEDVMVFVKNIFKITKLDLEKVVDELFPGNIGFQELLCVLTRALTKGGDDLYIKVSPKSLDFITFLEEADIIQFHPNDKTKVMLRHL